MAQLNLFAYREVEDEGDFAKSASPPNKLLKNSSEPSYDHRVSSMKLQRLSDLEHVEMCHNI